MGSHSQGNLYPNGGQFDGEKNEGMEKSAKGREDISAWENLGGNEGVG